MAKVLNEIYEQDFLKCSFGFRQGLSCHHALATVNELLYRRGMEDVLEVDIRDFFGSLSHEWLMRFLELRIGDGRVRMLIQAWLKAGIFEEGRWQEVERGTPQGGSISPLLANIYLHYVVDLWFERKIKPQFRGKAALVRYADDLCLFFAQSTDVDTMKSLLEARLGQFGLKLAEEKTHKTNLGARTNSETHERRKLTFLGFMIYRAGSVGKTVIKTVFQTEGEALQPGQSRNEGAYPTDATSARGDPGPRGQPDSAGSLQLLRARRECAEAPGLLELHLSGVATLSLEAEPDRPANLGGLQGPPG